MTIFAYPPRKFQVSGWDVEWCGWVLPFRDWVSTRQLGPVPDERAPDPRTPLQLALSLRVRADFNENFAVMSCVLL